VNSLVQSREKDQTFGSSDAPHSNKKVRNIKKSNSLKYKEQKTSLEDSINKLYRKRKQINEEVQGTRPETNTVESSNSSNMQSSRTRAKKFRKLVHNKLSIPCDNSCDFPDKMDDSYINSTLVENINSREIPDNNTQDMKISENLSSPVNNLDINSDIVSLSHDWDDEGCDIHDKKEEETVGLDTSDCQIIEVSNRETKRKNIKPITVPERTQPIRISATAKAKEEEEKQKLEKQQLANKFKYKSHFSYFLERRSSTTSETKKNGEENNSDGQSCVAAENPVTKSKSDHVASNSTNDALETESDDKKYLIVIDGLTEIQDSAAENSSSAYKPDNASGSLTCHSSDLFATGSLAEKWHVDETTPQLSLNSASIDLKSSDTESTLIDENQLFNSNSMDLFGSGTFDHPEL